MYWNEIIIFSLAGIQGLKCLLINCLLSLLLEISVVIHNTLKSFTNIHENICTNHLSRLACMVFHNAMLFLVAVFAGIPCTWCALFDCVIYVGIHIYPIHQFSHEKSHLLNPHQAAVKLV